MGEKVSKFIKYWFFDICPNCIKKELHRPGMYERDRSVRCPRCLYNEGKYPFAGYSEYEVTKMWKLI